MNLADVNDVVPDQTARAWPIVAAATPTDGVLMGGTALAIHLRHRVSRDLDVFTLAPFDVERVEHDLRSRGAFAAIEKSEGTLNGVLDGVKVQFLWAEGQRVLEAPLEVAGLAVGALTDVFATKVKVIGERGELRDYFDLMRIEEQTGRRVEEGLGLYLRRYALDDDHPSVLVIVQALGYLGDVERDPELERQFGDDIFDVVRRYWERRQPTVIGHLDRYGVSAPGPAWRARDPIDALGQDEGPGVPRA